METSIFILDWWQWYHCMGSLHFYCTSCLVILPCSWKVALRLCFFLICMKGRTFGKWNYYVLPKYYKCLFSLLTWMMSLINLIYGRTHYFCGRRKYVSIVLREYLIIFSFGNYFTNYLIILLTTNGLTSLFWNPDWTGQSDRKNWEPVWNQVF